MWGVFFFDIAFVGWPWLFQTSTKEEKKYVHSRPTVEKKFLLNPLFLNIKIKHKQQNKMNTKNKFIALMEKSQMLSSSFMSEVCL